eukprot:6999887-Prymnesium_polylepis.1
MVTFAQCMFGGEAQKYTIFAYSPGMHAMLQSLESQVCNHGTEAHRTAGGGGEATMARGRAPTSQ